MALTQLEQATLDKPESRTIRRFVELLEGRLGAGLAGVWLYGSRARGETAGPESDIDLMVVTAGGNSDAERVDDLLFEAAEREGSNPFAFSLQVVSPEWLDGRRDIRSFYIAEVDRDKIVLHGSS